MRIAITGIGIISAIGLDSTETLKSLLDEHSGIGPMRLLRSVHTELPVGEVPLANEALRAKANIGQAEPMSRSALLGLIAAREALAMSGRQCDAFISGTTVGGMDLTECNWEAYCRGEALASVRAHEAGATTQAIASQLGQFAITATPSTACSSALNAIILGANMLRSGQCRAALVGGTEALSKFHLNGFNSLMILDRNPCRPFDRNRNGLNLGEGAGYLVIEREDEALARGAEIVAYISGYANTCDAYHQTASSPAGEGAYRAMRNAVSMAGLLPADIDYVNAHGTGTVNNDSSESAALRRLFGEQMPPVSSVKGFTGHTTSASGGIEAAICVLALRHGFIPANIRWQNAGENIVVPVAQTEPRNLHHILCNAFGFGGNESSIVISDQGTSLSEVRDNRAIAPLLTIEKDETSDTSGYLSPAESRRLSPQMRRIVAAAREAIALSGAMMPDAILCATRWGCMLQSMRFMQDMLTSRERDMKPTPFIQSTHNTVASMIAILTGNHGYNATYSHGDVSYACAVEDIRAQFRLGLIHSALVVEFDEPAEEWNRVLSIREEPMHAVARAHIFKTT